ncbi:MAG: phosphonate C-P lyase system protein PhnG [Rhodospirillales bacterium]
MVDTLSPKQAKRRAWMGTLAKGTVDEIENAWAGLGFAPDYTWLRKPEFGSTMIRARAGGTGDPFNLGEATLTRCALRLADGTTGYAYVLGRSARHAELAALCDALLQTEEHNAAVEKVVIAPLAAAQAKRNEDESRRANATKVDFLAMARGVSLTSKVAYEDKGYQKS